MDRNARVLAVLATIAVLVAVVAAQFVPPMQQPTANEARAALTETMNNVAQRWPDLPHTPTETVAKRIGDDDFLLIDARSDEEFGVSHLKGAIHVPPDTSPEAFVALHGDKIAGKDVMFYCAVGVRSSTLATKLEPTLKKRGAKSVAEMAGGIFAWHNEKRPLTSARGETNLVHSYDAWWGRMVARQNLKRTAPVEPPQPAAQ